MRIAITGGSGLLALNWAVAMRDTHEICLLTHRHRVSLDGVSVKQVPLERPDELRRFLDEWGADMVVHTAGMTNVDQCEQYPELAQEANVDLAAAVAGAVYQHGARLVHISTDHLFAGDVPLVDEGNRPSPLNAYARTKLDGERIAREICPDSLVVRTNFYGWGHCFRESFSDWIIGSLQNKEPIDMLHDAWFTPVLIDRLAVAVHGLVDMGISGVINVSGDERISKYGFAQKVADVFALDATFIRRTSCEDMPWPTPRPKDMSLSNARVQQLLGHGIGDVQSGLIDLLKQDVQGRRDELLAAVSD